MLWLRQDMSTVFGHNASYAHQLGDATNWHSKKASETNTRRGQTDPDVCDKPQNVTNNVQIFLDIGVVEGKFNCICHI